MLLNALYLKKDFCHLFQLIYFINLLESMVSKYFKSHIFPQKGESARY